MEAVWEDERGRVLANCVAVHVPHEAVQEMRESGDGIGTMGVYGGDGVQII